MSQEQNTKERKRTLRNKPNFEQEPQTNQNTNEMALYNQNNQENLFDNQIAPTPEINQQAPPLSFSNMNEYNQNNANIPKYPINNQTGPIGIMNVESNPIPVSNDRILNENRVNSINIQQNGNIQNGPLNINGQFQAVPVQMSPVIIITRPMNITPKIIRVSTYSPINTVCYSCGVPVTTNPKLWFNCWCCCFWTLFSLCSYLIGFCIYLCWKEGDFCCYEADHKCPICGKTLARREYCCGSCYWC